MKYMIVYLLKGEAAFYQKNLSNELAHVFSMEEISQRIPPHVTLKSPFESRNVFDIEKILEKFAATHKPAPLTMEGFGHFDRRVIYMDVKPSDEALTLINDLTNELKKVPWLRFDQNDVEGNAKNKKLHATLAYSETKKLFDELAKYLKTESKKIEIMLDNIAILERGKEKWTLYWEYSLTALDSGAQKPTEEPA